MLAFSPIKRKYDQVSPSSSGAEVDVRELLLSGQTPPGSLATHAVNGVRRFNLDLGDWHTCMALANSAMAHDRCFQLEEHVQFSELFKLHWELEWVLDPATVPLQALLPLPALRYLHAPATAPAAAAAVAAAAAFAAGAATAVSEPLATPGDAPAAATPAAGESAGSKGGSSSETPGSSEYALGAVEQCLRDWLDAELPTWLGDVVVLLDREVQPLFSATRVFQ